MKNEVYMVRSTIAISENKEGRLSCLIAIGSCHYRILLSVLTDGKIFYSHVAMHVMCVNLSIFLSFCLFDGVQLALSTNAVCVPSNRDSLHLMFDW